MPSYKDLGSSFSRHSPEASLPFDIIEIIGAHLSRSGSSPRECSLTCRMWYSAVRPLIYRRVTIRSVDDTQRLHELTRSDPAVGRWIHELRISYDRRYLGLDDWFLDFPETFSSDTLSNIHSLHFRGQEAWHTSDIQLMKAIKLIPRLASFASVRRLSFLDCVVPYDFAKSIICAFPDLRDLHMHSVIYTQPHPRVELPQLYHPRNVESIRIHADDRLPADGFYSELLLPEMSPFTRSMRALTTLHFHFGGHTTPVMQELAKIVFPSEPNSLQHLEFYFPICQGYSAVALASCNRFIVENLNMGIFPDLRTFHVRGLNQADPTHSLISALNSPHLNRLVLGVETSALESSKSKHYAPVDACLADTRKFSKLQKVHVFAYNVVSEDLETITQKVQELFPKVMGRGILETSFVGDPDKRCDLYI